MDRARRSTDASDEQEPKRPCLAGGHNGGAGGAGGSDAGGDGGDAGDDDSHSDAGGSGGDVGAGGGVGHAADGPRTLSTLGDDLLGAILSRLESSRQTVRMCMLSSRWRHLWRSVPSIHIDQREFGSDHEVQSFTDFLLDHHNNLVLLDAFRLLLSSEDLRLPACHWVRRVISQDDTPPYQLKRLHLCNVHLDKDFASHISDGRCPALEDVRLENCSYFTTRYKITSSSLKKLVVDGLHMVQDHYQGDDNDDDDDEILKLIIEAPALVSLRLAGELDHIVDTTEPHTMPALVDASVHLPMMTDEELNDIEENDATAYQSALGALFNVTSLNLSHFGLLFPDDSLELSVLENLRTLFLDECYVIGNDFVGLEPYLQKSPNLEKLTLRCSKQWYFGREDPVDFMCENLMLTEIIYQHDDDVAHLLVKFLLSMSRSLPNNKIELIRVE